MKADRGRGAVAGVRGVALDGRHRARDRDGLRSDSGERLVIRPVRRLPSALCLPRRARAGDHRRDHALEAELHAVLGREDAGDAVGLELRDLLRDDRAAAAAVDLDVARRRASRSKSTTYLKYSTWPPWYDEIAMPSASSSIAVSDDVAGGAVVPEVDHLGALRLQDAAHDVDRGVVAVEERGGGDEADGSGHEGSGSAMRR